MSKASYFRFLQLTYLAQPRRDRRLYRQLQTMSATRIVEVGLGSGQRAQNMISLALRLQVDKPIRYTGIDLFEARPNDKSFSLKFAHQLLTGEGYEVRLVPGEPAMALSRCANELRGTDLIVVSSQISKGALAAGAHFLHRMLHKDSQVWVEHESDFEILGPAELRALAPSRRAA